MVLTGPKKRKNDSFFPITQAVNIGLTSSNHRLGSAGLNALEELLDVGNREDGNACLVLKA